MFLQVRYLKGILLLLLIVIIGCNSKRDKDSVVINRLPVIFPDYTYLTIPPNIAPLNFKINEEGDKFEVVISCGEQSFSIKSKNGKVIIPDDKWKTLLKHAVGKRITYTVYAFLNEEWQKFSSFTSEVVEEKIDQYLFYRLLYPGYELWNEMGIYGRDLTSFDETPLIENKSVHNHCVNCHSFNQNSPDTFMFHMRGERGGTIISKGGHVDKLNVKTQNMLSGGVYPAWHPNGKYIAFSTNKIQQFFHAQGDKLIDVSDFASNLVVLDTETNTVLSDSSIQSSEYMETFPNWSPDGKYLYYTSAVQRTDTMAYNTIRYNLMRVAFDAQEKKFGQVELIYNAEKDGKSVTFPKISPDNQYLMFTLCDYGTFSIWHKEADLYMMDLKTKAVTKLLVNSNDVESYHSWSSNSAWFVFSSKRLDGQCARPYFSYVGKDGTASKPFVLPQKDPEFYNSFLKTYNITELVRGPFDFDTWKLVREASFRAEKVNSLD